MVITKLTGGLGNQMFQYAMARSISGTQPVYLDLSFLQSNAQSNEAFTARKFELAVFKNIKSKNFNSILARLITTESRKYKLFKFILLKFLPKINIITDENVQDIPQTSPAVYLDGYFQNPTYFELIREQLLNEFEFPLLPKALGTLKENISKAPNAVSIHVRRGDYLKPNIAAYHGVLNMEYYQKAISQFNTENIEPHYFIFSDDPQWCASSFDFLINKTVISHQHSAWVDMYLMSLCTQHIIANSSFSWWGAWLSQSKKRKVIAPTKWFNEASSDIVPQEWILI